MLKNLVNSIFFGSVVENIWGAVLAKEVGTRTKFLQVIWKIFYDDADVEQMNGKEIIGAMSTRRLHCNLDFIGSNKP